jgi:molybdate transport system regulatory protein
MSAAGEGMARLNIRIDLPHEERLSPGKVLLLERIAAHGSIAAAGRSMGISYRRVWELAAATNAPFRRPLVAARLDGPRGRGAHLTPLHQSLVAHDRQIERAATAAAEPHLRPIDQATRPARAPRLPPFPNAPIEPAPPRAPFV